jgi:2-oxo-4-hydroxy-4-carboxy-5-ureidoimidazoline decarboxylase
MKDRRKMDLETFLSRYGGVYEHSPWIAEACFGTGLKADTLSRAMRQQVEEAGKDKQLALLRAHPDLAGKLAVQGGLTDESTSEQAGAGLDQCTADEYARFQALNTEYQEKFQFPFILAVKGFGRAEILEIFETRVHNAYVKEFREALDQVHRIAYLRLSELDMGALD